MKQALVLTLGLVAGVALPIACSFPTLTFDNGAAGAGGPASGPGPGSGGSTSASTLSAGAGQQTGTGASGGGGSTGAAGGTSTGTAGGTSTGTAGGGDGGPPCFKNCDCDNDGHMAMACGGDDCADYEPNAHGNFPDAGWHPSGITSPLAPGYDVFDWNCDGTREREWTDVCTKGLANYTCTTPGVDTWATAAPDCGNGGNVVECKSNGLGGATCKPAVVVGTRTQKCH